MARCIGRWIDHSVIGLPGSVEYAAAATTWDSTYLASGFFRAVYKIGLTVYKVTDDGHDVENVREFNAEMRLARCGCAASVYAAPTSLWQTDDRSRVIIAQRYYRRDGSHADIRARNAFVHAIRQHNEEGHTPLIADMLEDNYRLTGTGQITITDLNLDTVDYQWLVETSTTGRIV